MSELKIFTAPGCAPCDSIKDAIRDGSLSVEGVPVQPEDIELVDVSTDEGYPAIEEYQLNESGIPVAFYEGQRCKLLTDEATGQVTVDCSEVNQEPDDDREPETL